jgi:hypothetical protein
VRLNEYDLESLHQTLCAQRRDLGLISRIANLIYSLHVRLLVALIRRFKR